MALKIMSQQHDGSLFCFISIRNYLEAVANKEANRGGQKEEQRNKNALLFMS